MNAKESDSLKQFLLPLSNWVYSKRADLHSEKHIISFQSRPLPERSWCTGRQTQSQKSCLPLKKKAKNLSIPLK